jgi:hypothetical protein
MLVGSIADMAWPDAFAKRTTGRVRRTIDHDFFSMP